MVQLTTPTIKGASTGNAGLELEGELRHQSEASKPPAQPRAGFSREIGGPAGPEPTRYGDWERNGRCIDF